MARVCCGVFRSDAEHGEEVVGMLVFVCVVVVVSVVVCAGYGVLAVRAGVR